MSGVRRSCATAASMRADVAQAWAVITSYSIHYTKLYEEVRLPPPAVNTPYLESLDRRLPFAPDYGEQTDKVLARNNFV